MCQLVHTFLETTIEINNFRLSLSSFRQVRVQILSDSIKILDHIFKVEQGAN